MIWIIKGNQSFSAIGANVSMSEGQASLWIERPTGKTIRVATDTQERIALHKEAIDFAIKNGHKTYEV